MFEQSLLLDHGTKKAWNFLASFGVQLVIVSLALLIPLIFRDQLPAVHWKDVMVGPPPSRSPVVVQTSHASGSTTPTMAAVEHRPFQWNPRATLQPVGNAGADFVPDAPPSLGVEGGIGGGNKMLGNLIPNVIATPPKPEVETKHASAPVPVGGDVQMAKLLRKVIPEYPALARSARISGVVRLVGIISKDGTIRDLQLVSGHPLLAHAAMEAVRQWVYKPTLLNGMPVEVIAPIELNFTLAQ